MAETDSSDAGGGSVPYFISHSPDFRLSWNQPEGALSFRLAQVGALFSLAGHLQTSDEPAQAILPTGVGKTAVICALPFLVRTQRALVVVPTTLLRDQIADELATLQILQNVGAVDFPERPRVERVDHRLSNAQAWQDLEEFDVVVGTPMVLSAENTGVAEPPSELFDLLIFDEAHHLPATTWHAMLTQHHRRAALVTATPFRRDRKLLPGSIVYHYGLSEAMKDGVYAPVEFIPVEAAEDDDESVARKAIERINSVEHVADESLVLIRSDRIDHARQLVQLYEELGVPVGLITSHHSLRHARRVIQKLRKNELRGVVSVGALVEGFDMPRLKVAAYHRPHRSLPPTLQFIGRIARVTGGSASAELVAARGSRLTSETAELYQEDNRAWSELLPALTDAAVAQEQAVRTYVAEADIPIQDQDISAGAIRPRRFVQVFETCQCGDLDLTADLHIVGQGSPVFDFVDTDARLRALILERRVRPDWIASHVLDTADFHLILIVENSDADLLFMTGPSVAALKRIREDIGASEALRVSPQRIANYLAAQNPEAYSSVGMRAGRAPGARLASYRMLAGSAVQGAISDAEARSHAIGHVIGRRFSEGQSRGVGASLKGAKIWHTEECHSLLEFRDWCDELASVLGDEGLPSATIPHLEQVGLQQLLLAFPEHPIAAVLDHRLLQGGHRIVDGNNQQEIIDFELLANRTDSSTLTLELQLEAETVWSGELTLRGEVSSDNEDVLIRFPDGHTEPVAEALQEFEPYIYFADGTSTTGNLAFDPPRGHPTPPTEIFEAWDWDGCDITKETTQPDGGLRNVQDHTVVRALEHFDNALVIVDHNSGEIADVVVIERLQQAPDTKVRVHLMHCKGSTEEQPGQRLNDLYEVIGQTIRSARWTHPSGLFRELARRWHHRPSINVESDEQRDEVAEILQAWANQPPETELVVWTVQPGLSIQNIEGWPAGSTLISAAYGWSTTSEGATFRLAGS